MSYTEQKVSHGIDPQGELLIKGIKPEEAAYTIYLIEKCFESNKKQARISCKED